MKVWIDRDLCTGNGICEEIAPVVIALNGSLAYVRDTAGSIIEDDGDEAAQPVPRGHEEAVIEAAEECPGECIYLLP